MQEQTVSNSDEYSDEDKNSPGGVQIKDKIEKCGDKSLIDVMHRKLEEQILFLKKKSE